MFLLFDLSLPSLSPHAFTAYQNHELLRGRCLGVRNDGELRMSVCVFCAKWGQDGDLLIHGSVVSFTPLNPVAEGHRLFVPTRHFASPHEDPILAGLVFGEAARWAGERPVAYNLIVNSGQSAGQTVFHLHIHYVPRHPGDGLLMPWGGVK